MHPSVLLPDTEITRKIFLIRGHKVMLDYQLAELYEIPTRRLNEQVKRNLSRFPKDFMFQLTEEEWLNLMSQNATSSSAHWGGRRKLPYAFTEHGVLMLSSVLNSHKAIQVNIQIMRIYIRFREMMLSHKDILLKLEKAEKDINRHDEQIQQVFYHLKQLLKTPEEERPAIGYRAPLKK